MYWEEGGFDSWAFYEVRGQPAAVLVDADGIVIRSWFGAFPEDEVLDLAREV